MTASTSMQSPLRRHDNRVQSHAFAPSGERGYVLLFVLGLLSVVATVVLGTSVGLRLDAQLLATEKAALQEEYLLKGAARYAAIQLGIAAAVEASSLDPRDETFRQWELWRITDDRQHQITMGDSVIGAALEDVSGLPDANLLTAQEWERLLLLMGMPSQEEARTLATKITALRETLERVRGIAGGFWSLQELLTWHEIPEAIAFGGSDTTPLGLQHLLVVGSRSKKVSLDKTPLLLIQALGNVSDEKSRQLNTLRKAGPIQAPQAQQWLQGTQLTALPPGAKPTAVRAHLRIQPPAKTGRSLVAILVSENSGFAIADQLPDPEKTAR
jgi:hypothetical protein